MLKIWIEAMAVLAVALGELVLVVSGCSPQ